MWKMKIRCLHDKSMLLKKSLSELNIEYFMAPVDGLLEQLNIA